MSSFLLLLGYLFMGEELFSVHPGQQESVSLYLLNQKEITRVKHSGQPVSLSHHSLVYKLEGGNFQVIPLGEKQSRTIQPMGVKLPETIIPLFSMQIGMETPFVFSRNALHILNLDTQKWVALDHSPSYSFLEPGREISGTYGLRVRFPVLVSLPDNGTLIYDQRTGLSHVFDRHGYKKMTTQLPKRARPVRNENKIYWLNIPEEGVCSESSLIEPLLMKQSFHIRDLNRYGMVERNQYGFWVISFPVGLKQSLKSWDTGKVELTLTHIAEVDGKTKTSRSSLPQAPLNFELTASDSGSPKLGVTPDFFVIPVTNTDELIFGFRQGIVLVSPSQDIKRGRPISGGKPIAIRKVENEYIAWDKEMNRIKLLP